MPNSFAYLTLLLWPVAAAVLFRLLSAERALIWTVLGGYLLLPQGAEFNLPVVPELDKATIPNIAALLLCLRLHGLKALSFPKSLAARALFLLFLVSPVATALTNREPVPFGNGGGLPGMSIYDAVSFAANQALAVIPFFLARSLLAGQAAQREILWALMAAGLFYSVPVLIEVRLSPQLHVWIYGFFQHSFEQMMRGGGFRPIVFLYHALWVGFLTMSAFVAALGLWRAAQPHKRTLHFLAAGYLAVILVLCKTLGALLYALFLLPLALFAGRRLQVRIAAFLALLAFAYPVLRGADLVPVDWMLAQAAAIAEERARSLGVRLENEAELLVHAQEKILFGWGGWGRNLIYDARGESGSITDGRWIIVIGIYGWCGYLVEFGLLTLPLFLLARRIRRVGEADLSPFLGTLALLHGINLVDLLPNATLTPLTWLAAGALLGHAELLADPRRRGEARPPPRPPEAPRTVIPT